MKFQKIIKELSKLVFLPVLLISISHPADSEILAVRTTQKSLTLANALAMATLHEGAIVSAHAGVKQAQSEKLATISKFLPSLTLSDQAQLYGPIGRTGNTFIAGTQVSAQHSFYYNSISANLSENIFDGGKNMAELKAARESIKSANNNLLSVLNNKFEKILRAYSALSVDQQKIISDERIVSFRRRMEKLIYFRFQHKFSGRIEWLQEQEKVLESEKNLLSDSQQQIEDAKSLLRAIGYRYPPARIVRVETLPLPPPVIQSLPKRNLRDPAIQAALEQVSVAQEEVSEARAGFFPKLSLVAQYNWLGLNLNRVSSAIVDTRGSNYSVGLSLTIPLLPAINTVAAVQSAQAQVQDKLGAYQTTLASIGSRRVTSWLKYENAKKEMQLAISAEKTSREELNLTKQRWRAHISNMLPVYKARITNIQSALDVHLARNNLRLAQWELFRTEKPLVFSRKLLSAAQNETSISR